MGKSKKSTQAAWNPPDPIWGPEPFSHVQSEEGDDRVQVTEWRCADCFQTAEAEPAKCPKCGGKEFLSIDAIIKGSQMSDKQRTSVKRIRLSSDMLEMTRQKRMPEENLLTDHSPKEDKKNYVKAFSPGGPSWQEEMDEMVTALRKEGLSDKQIRVALTDVWGSHSGVKEYLDTLLT